MVTTGTTLVDWRQRLEREGGQNKYPYTNAERRFGIVQFDWIHPIEPDAAIVIVAGRTDVSTVHNYITVTSMWCVRAIR